MSQFEQKIVKILQKSGVKFEKEKVFKDCYNGYYRYDFYLPDKNIVIEANGIQHYKFTKIFHKNRSDFLKGQERDRRKISYCLAKDIKIYCIPYWEMDNLKNLDDILNPKFQATSKFWNDEVWRKNRPDS